ncbi:MAG: hypothetical protein K0S01_3558 [Herbinix sp.]|jgi:hypothetical protein|nr:hypothetical protein [Herbinix sp.]
MMKKYIYKELQFGIKSKFYYIIAGLLSIMFIVLIYYNYSSVIKTHERYLYYESYYIKNGIDINKDLSGSYKVETDANGGTTVTNPILYFKELVGRYAYVASPKYTLSQLLESSILFFPLVFGAFGLFISNVDFKYNMTKCNTVRINKRMYNIAKQTSLIVSSIIILISSLTISYFINLIFYKILSARIPLDNFDIKIVNYHASIVNKFLYGFILALLFVEIGYTLGYITKNIIAGIMILALYLYIVPILGKYDLKNIMYYLGSKCFDYYGSINIIEPIKVPLLLSLFIIFLILAGSIIINICISIKRSSYN